MNDNSSGFASNDPNAAASGQSAHGATASNTDTSGATRLDPASDARARQGFDESTGLDSAQGGTKESGVGPTYNVAAGGGSSSGGSTNRDDSYGTSSSGADSYGSDSNKAGTAPSYVGASDLAQEQEARSGPHGKNITEGGFDSDAPNASFNQDIGGENDPGRLAEEKFSATNARSGYDVGGSGQRQGGVSGGGAYDALGDEGAPDTSA